MPSLPVPAAVLDVDPSEWPRSLRAGGQTGEEAAARLHALLLRAARFEVARRRSSLPHLRAGDLDDIASDAAGDALMSVLRRLDDFHGDSRFSTWAYKFALREASVKLRKRAWEGREIPLELEASARFSSGDVEPDAQAEQSELLGTLRRAIAELTPRQRRVFVAVAVNGVPVDVVADRLGTTRGSLSETLRDARRRLRSHLGERGLNVA